MYIPEFWCGFIAGMVIGITGMIIFALYMSKR